LEVLLLRQGREDRAREGRGKKGKREGETKREREGGNRDDAPPS